MADITMNYPPLPQFPLSDAYNTSSYNFINSKPVPPTLWRIYNDTSVSRRLPDGSFLAGSPDRIINMNDPENVAIELKLHLNWYCPVKTVLISSSENRNWVRYHALKRERKGRKNVRVAQINTALALACGVELFHMIALAKFSQSEIPQRAANSAQNEWVFVGEIPSLAVVADYSAREFASLRLLITPGVQYPMQSGWSLSPWVNQHFNVDYGLNWQNININPSPWYFGSGYIWQSPSGPFISSPLTTSSDRYDYGHTPASAGGTVRSDMFMTEEEELAYAAADDQESVDIFPALTRHSIDEASMAAGGAETVYPAIPTLPTTMGTESYITYPTLSELPSKIATTHSLARAAVVELGGNQQQADNESRGSMFELDSGDFRMSSPEVDPRDRILYWRNDTEHVYGSDTEHVYESDTEHVYGSDTEHVYGSDTEYVYGSDSERYVSGDSEYEESDYEEQDWN
ncbi:hypothetical protein EV426DRAFT_597317 [Tirmania nivea]|nr:hypothetical protein EV426DRAFT_597317 [Tirmania nivea]